MNDIDKWRSLPPITYTNGKWSDGYTPPDPSSPGRGFIQLDSYRTQNEDEVAAADRIRFIASLAHRSTSGLPDVQRIFDIAEFDVGAIRSLGRREGLAVLVRDALRKFFDVLAGDLSVLTPDTEAKKVTTGLLTQMVGVINGLIAKLDRA